MVASLLIVLVAGIGYLVFTALRDTEKRLYEQALAEFKDERYKPAAEKFRELAERYADSENIEDYKFLADTANVLDRAGGSRQDPEQSLEILDAYHKLNKDQPRLEPYREHFFRAYQNLARALIDAAERDNKSEQLEKARGVIAKLSTYKKKEADDTALAALNAEVDRVVVVLNRRKIHDELAELLKQFLAHPRPENIEEWKLAVELAGMQQEQEFANAIPQLLEQLRLQIVYRPAHGGAQLPPREDEPAVPVSPSLLKDAPAVPPTDRTVFALARGVLYALNQGTGAVRWVSRVGIDTYNLPVRLPATPLMRETALVLSSDTNTLTAREVHSGRPLWQHRLTAPSLARPVVIERLAYVATVDGKVHVIETSQGRLVGRYDLGQRLTVGGTPQQDTTLLYFPADRQNVYVLDVSPARARQPCLAIVETGHPSGSLRSEPVVISRTDPAALPQGKIPWADYLVLNQTDGLGATKLRVFGRDRANDGPPDRWQHDERLSGWSWFPAYRDPEKLALVTDRGEFGLFGVNQLGNRDEALFSVFLQTIPGAPSFGQPSRAQVVHAAEDNLLWLLTHGRLQKYHFDQFSTQLPEARPEPKLHELWPNRALLLGAAQHDAQVDEDGKTLFVVTQVPNSPTCLATAVDADSGTILWQRQLGLLCHGDPVPMAGDVVFPDQGGGLFVFGQGAGDGRPVERGLPAQGSAEAQETIVNGPDLVTGPDGRTVYSITCVDRGAKEKAERYRLVVRRYEAGKQTPELLKPVERWPAPLAGTPAVGPEGFVFPLADGNLRRQPFDEGAGNPGPPWGAPYADEGARGHVLQLGPEDYLFTNGSRTLTRLHWKKDTTWEKQSEVNLPVRIAAAPLLLRREKDEPLVCVADSSGAVILLYANDLKREKYHQWNLSGTITAGPFLRGQQIGCVVDEQTLVWLDPAKKESPWKQPYTTKGQRIVGQPQLIGDMIVVAELSGNFVGLDPSTGRPLWESGHELEASVAPAATPVPFGKDQALVPLTDGTLTILHLKHLRHPLRDFTPP